MGRWEGAIQMDCGAVMGGMIKSEPTPAVFNTGMVLLGWADLYRRTGADAFRGLAEMGAALGEKAFVEATTRNAEFAIGKQHENVTMDACAY